MGIVRFLLAFAVVVFHAAGDFFGMKIIPGYVCVELFFIVSGFYMEFILTGSYAKKRNFYSSRFFRLWPLFFVVGLSYILFESGYELLMDKAPMISKTRMNISSNPWLSVSVGFSNLFMIGQDIFSWFYVGPDGAIRFFYATFLEGVDKNGYTWGGYLRTNGPAWSIGLEIWFYLLVPFLHKLGNKFLLLIFITSAVLRICLTPVIGTLTYFFFPTQLYLFLAGMLAFRYREQLKVDNRIALGLYFLLVGAILLFAYIPLRSDVMQYILLPAIMFVAINSMFKNFIKVKWDKFIGDLSYPIYITHSFILLITPKLLEYAGLQLAGRTLHVLSYITIIVISSFWVFKIEKIINAYRWRLFKN
jgi:peptidoglycan/LPS O-acetylase OafA/YrhL